MEKMFNLTSICLIIKTKFYKLIKHIMNLNYKMVKIQIENQNNNSIKILF